MKTVLIISPTEREYRALPDIAARLNCRVIFEDFAGSYFDDLLAGKRSEDNTELDILGLIEEKICRYSKSALAGVTSGVGYPGMPVSSIMARRLGLPGPEIDSVLRCEHKYYSRLAQLSVVPEAVPPFCLVDPTAVDGLPSRLQFPLFLKPVKSCFSINADRIDDREMFRRKVASSLLPANFLKPLNELIRAYTDFPLDANCLLAESLLEGRQVSLEGYAIAGRVHIMGIVDSIMYPGTNSFERFEYPSSLPEGVQQRMKQIATTVISGVGYDNALFNIELMYEPITDGIHIIEINPKIASQFADLFEKVDGLSTYLPLLQVALGEEPTFPHRQGAFQIAASCVLRSFKDGQVLNVPSEDKINGIVRRFPDARIEVNVSRGQRLSDVMQDGKSYRYGLINIGADSHDELIEKLAFCKSSLDFQFCDP